MTRDPAWSESAHSQSPAKGAGSVACLAFVIVLGAAFWAGALWAAQPWLH